MKKEVKKSKQKLNILPKIYLILLLIVSGSLIIYLRFFDIFVDLYFNLGWMAFTFTLISSILIVVSIIFFNYSKESNLKTLLLFLVVSIGLILLFSLTLLWNQTWDSSSFKLLVVIILFSVFFGYLSAFPKHFLSEFVNVSGKHIVRLGFLIFFRVFIPMMFVCILILGSLHGKYGYESTFLLDSNNSISTASMVLTNGFYKLIETVYLLGESRPNFYLFLSFGLIVGLFIYLFLKKDDILTQQDSKQSNRMKGGNTK